MGRYLYLQEYQRFKEAFTLTERNHGMEGKAIGGPEGGSAKGGLEIRNRVPVKLRSLKGNVCTGLSYRNHTTPMLEF